MKHFDYQIIVYVICNSKFGQKNNEDLVSMFVSSSHDHKFGVHYANISVQYNAIFHGCKNGNFQMKKINVIFLLKT